VVVRYRMYLKSRHLAANTINQQLAAVRRLARVVTLPDADHYIYRSNEADVLREINLFVSSLK
jgi:hypothetical protein